MDSLKCQTDTVSPAKPGDFPFLVKMIVAQSIASSLDAVDRGARVILRGVVVIGVD